MFLLEIFEVTQKQTILHKHELVVTQYIPLFVFRICGTLCSSLCNVAAKEEIHYINFFAC